MRSTARLMTVVVALSATSAFAADWPWIYGPAGNSTSDQKGLLRTWPEAGPKVLWTAPVGRRLRRPGRQRRQGLPARPGREGRRQAARVRPVERQGTLELRLRRSGPVHVSPARARRRRSTASTSTPSGPLGDLYAINTKTQQAGLAQEHLEGLRRRRAAPVGDRPEPADLRQPADRGAADVPGGRRRLRQADGRAQVEVGSAVRHARVREPVHRQGRRRRPSGHGHGRRGTGTQRQGRQRQRPRPAQRQGALDVHELAVHHPGSAAGRRRRRPRAHHGRIRRRHRDDQGRRRRATAATRSRSCSRTPTSAPTPSRRSSTTTTSIPTTRSTSAATASSR